ncbi:hypothetical protein [Pantoea dispersa]|uniref:Uncharacterized protein n=1 Tax=Pantoea dispersa TaxID=59814 RepID=A0A8E1VBC5_9GAMM|nr:hypothetical protein [Pantoea dispersa]KTR90895.1 hypothetical protein SA2_07915 [Pantoea dispersa]KTS23771.1 hypothetical protein SA4R_04640 [Pantoea dispersa]KTS56724.1 hypothetical protein SA5R_19095 [Pantoea dispersa]KTS69655.1 hypothetical protein SA3R_00035 [Pantoea dispersa]
MNSYARLVKIIADMAIFLEFSDEESLDPDIAVGMMESIAAELQLISLDDKKKVANTFYLVSKVYQGDRAVYIKQLSESLGLI